MKVKKRENDLSINRKAFHDFAIHSTHEAGIELKGTEVKSCKQGNISMADSYARIIKGEVFLYNVHIAQYGSGNQFNHEPKRIRRLLLHKHEILKLSQHIKERGRTLIALRFYLRRGKVKVELGLAKGKTKRDKRQDLRRKDDKMSMKKALKYE